MRGGNEVVAEWLRHVVVDCRTASLEHPLIRIHEEVGEADRTEAAVRQDRL